MNLKDLSNYSSSESESVTFNTMLESTLSDADVIDMYMTNDPFMSATSDFL